MVWSEKTRKEVDASVHIIFLCEKVARCICKGMEVFDVGFRAWRLENGRFTTNIFRHNMAFILYVCEQWVSLLWICLWQIAKRSRM